MKKLKYSAAEKFVEVKDEILLAIERTMLMKSRRKKEKEKEDKDEDKDEDEDEDKDEEEEEQKDVSGNPAVKKRIRKATLSRFQSPTLEEWAGKCEREKDKERTDRQAGR